jgi:hypothetical protein
MCALPKIGVPLITIAFPMKYDPFLMILGSHFGENPFGDGDLEQDRTSLSTPKRRTSNSTSLS